MLRRNFSGSARLLEERSSSITEEVSIPEEVEESGEKDNNTVFVKSDLASSPSTRKTKKGKSKKKHTTRSDDSENEKDLPSPKEKCEVPESLSRSSSGIMGRISASLKKSRVKLDEGEEEDTKKGKKSSPVSPNPPSRNSRKNDAKSKSSVSDESENSQGSSKSNSFSPLPKSIKSRISKSPLKTQHVSGASSISSSGAIGVVSPKVAIQSTDSNKNSFQLNDVLSKTIDPVNWVKIGGALSFKGKESWKYFKLMDDNSSICWLERKKKPWETVLDVKSISKVNFKKSDSRIFSLELEGESIELKAATEAESKIWVEALSILLAGENENNNRSITLSADDYFIDEEISKGSSFGKTPDSQKVLKSLEKERKECDKLLKKLKESQVNGFESLESRIDHHLFSMRLVVRKMNEIDSVLQSRDYDKVVKQLEGLMWVLTKVLKASLTEAISSG